jgi:hypothetical protein
MLLLFFQDQMIKMYGFGQIADYVRWIMALGGASYLAAGIWVIVWYGGLEVIAGKFTMARL